MEKKLREKVEKARKIQQDRNEDSKGDQHNAASILRKTQALKTAFEDIEETIKGLGKIVERQKKKLGEDQSAKRLKIQANYWKILDNLKEREKDAQVESKNKRYNKKALDDSINLDVNEEDLNNSLIDGGPDDEEAAASQRWKENDKKMDNLFDGIINTLDQLESGLKDQDEKIDNLKSTQKKLEKGMDKVDKKFETTNSKLKKILTQFRSPHKFCMDVVLILIFLVMLGIGYKVISA